MAHFWGNLARSFGKSLKLLFLSSGPFLMNNFEEGTSQRSSVLLKLELVMVASSCTQNAEQTISGFLVRSPNAWAIHVMGDEFEPRMTFPATGAWGFE